MNDCMNFFTLKDVSPKFVRCWILYIARSSIVLIIYGILTIIYGATNDWKNSDDYDNLYIYPLEIPHYAPTTFLYGFGIYFVFNGLLGLMVAVVRNYDHSNMVFILRTYILGPVVPLGLSLMFILIQILLWNHTKRSIEDILVSYRTSFLHSTYTWDKDRMHDLHTKYQCCGVYSYKEWLEIPASCCLHKPVDFSDQQYTNGCHPHTSQELLANSELASHYVQSSGCVDAILYRYIYHYLIVAAFIVPYIFIMIIGLMFGFKLIHYYKRLPNSERTETVELNTMLVQACNRSHPNTELRRCQQEDCNHMPIFTNNRTLQTSRSLAPVNSNMENINQNHVALLQNYENILNERQLVANPHTVV